MPAKKIIYAVIENNAEDQLWDISSSNGIGDAPLEMVAYRDLLAVISSVDAARFDPGLSDQAASTQELLKADLLKYQQVNSYLLEKSVHGGMLPLTFGLTSFDNHDVETVLERAYLQLRTHLDRLKGKVELVVQASWDMSRIIPEIARIHPEFISADPVQTGKLLFDAAEAKKKGFIEAIHNQLSPLAQDFSDGSHKTKSLILNRSYMVARTQEIQFDAAVNTLAEHYDAILDFRYIGPLPAYSFVNIELNQGNFALLDQARKSLQLPEIAGWRQIKSAYRQLLLANHPDQHPGDPDAAKRCKEVVAAFAVVSSYCQSFQSFSEPDNEEEYVFTRGVVEKAFIIDTKGAVLATGCTSHLSLKHYESSISL
ncbi:MAG: GvpL/GvpF family gas vesicle protein [Candidatus Nitrotoga sp.]|nr:GvpL/GvpF family gas vesicle protein [Candidatus Nitrotoga sp.]